MMDDKGSEEDGTSSVGEEMDKNMKKRANKASEDATDQPAGKRAKGGSDEDSGAAKRSTAQVAKKRPAAGSNTEITSSAAKQAPSKGTYPKPKNFAERMMNVLENNVDPKVIKWHGEEDLIAINTDSIKDSDILANRFQGIRYAAFIRNLSRWGFRKVPKLEVEDGVVVYRNTLFQRENPHLVRHMKIDSDVQDIFGQHQRSSQRETTEDPGHGAAQAQPSAPQFQQRQAPPQQPVGFTPSNNSMNLLTQLMNLQRQSQNQPQQGNDPPSVESQLQSLQAALSVQGGGTIPPTPVRTPNEILREIIGLSKEYLEAVPESTGSASGESIKTLLRLLVGLGTEQVQTRDPDGLLPPGSQPPAAAAQATQLQSAPSRSTPLLNELLNSMEHQQGMMPSQQHAGMLGLQHPQQQQQAGFTQQLSGQEADLQNILAQATGITSLSGAPFSPQLLLQLQQQQQQQRQQNQGRNNNLPSPPGNNCRQS